jgi:hypothetical protein
MNEIEKAIYDVLMARPFCKCCIEEENKLIYEAYCLRVAETVDMKLIEGGINDERSNECKHQVSKA